MIYHFTQFAQFPRMREYAPPLEGQGREVALEKLVADIVDGAQSQW